LELRSVKSFFIKIESSNKIVAKVVTVSLGIAIESNINGI
jgi:hypothetical protein